MARKPLAEKPMTSAERVRRHREKLKAGKLTVEKCLREIDSLVWKNKSLRATNRELREELKELNDRPSVLDAMIEFMTAGHTQLSEDDLGLLKQLCHPDKHGQSEASNKASVLLNKLTAKPKQ